MESCPICSAETPDGALECPRCHLSTGLYGAVQAAIDVPPDDPQYLVKAREVAASLGGESHAAELSGPARLSQASRFLPLPAPPAQGASASPVEPKPTILPGLPALPAAPDVAAMRRRIDEYFQIGRREGIDLTPFQERTRLAVETQNREQLEALDRELFVVVASALTHEYEAIIERQAELEALVPAGVVDAELSSCRSSIALGDLSGAQRRLAHVEQTLSDLEDEWATVQILLAESELLADTVRELGGDPGPALGPLEEGRRLARSGLREEAEPILARAVAAQWAILEPRFSADLDRLRDAVLKARDGGGDVAAVSADLSSVAAYLRHRNFASAVAAYRRVRDWAEKISPSVSAGEPAPAEPDAPVSSG